jgi:hypothetical protein
MKDLTQIERGNTISFFHELDIETRTMLITSISFFNEVATEMKKLSSETSVLDHGFQEDNAPEGDHVKGKNSVMASKRSSLEGRNTLWKNTMSRVVTGVKRSGSNNPNEEITMSTTGSKSTEVEAMGDNAT